jgi:ApaG protein
MSSKHGSECVTRFVRVRVHPAFLPDHSRPGESKFVFGYRIRISNEGDVRVRLLSRHWIIVDGDGARREVKGDGVVGQQPELAPGAFFEYSSYCPLEHAWGTMEGSYQMLDHLGERFDARIERFYLVSEFAGAGAGEEEPSDVEL